MTYLGNISILDQPKHGFLCSRCTKSTAILPSLDWAMQKSNGSEPVMSTFHSELEIAVLDILTKGRCPVILVLGRSLYKVIPGNLKPLLDSDRLLIISICNQTRISKESSAKCNKYICDNANDITVGYLSEESSLCSIIKDATSNCKPINILNK